jgi:hypothetical protein
MKKIFYFMAAAMMIFTACEETDDVLPDDNGDARDAFIGTWNVNDTQLKSSDDSYTVQISADVNNSSQVIIYNFGLLNGSVTAVVAGDDIEVPMQEVNGWTVESASGMLNGSGDEINWTYTLSDGADAFHYAAVYTLSE